MNLFFPVMLFPAYSERFHFLVEYAYILQPPPGFCGSGGRPETTRDHSMADNIRFFNENCFFSGGLGLETDRKTCKMSPRELSLGVTWVVFRKESVFDDQKA